jgi:hypothetical protein
MVWLSRLKSELSPLFWPMLAYKLICSITLGLMYWQYYQAGDTISYHEEAIRFTGLFHQDPQSFLKALAGTYDTTFEQTLIFSNQPRALFFTRIISVFYLLTGNNYWITSLYVGLFAFTGAYMLSTQLTRRNPEFKWPSVLAFMGLPSVVFWSSGVLKESLVMGMMWILLYLSLNPWKKRMLLKVMAFLIFSVLLWKLKYFYALLYIPIVLLLTIEYGLSDQLKSSKRWIGYILPFILFFLLTLFHPNLNLNRFWHMVVKNHTYYLGRGLETIDFVGINESVFSLIPNIPAALFLGWFGPFLDFRNLLYAMISLENLVLVVLFATVSWGKLNFHHHKYLVIALGLFVLIETLFVTISTPVYGTLVRYRIAYQCFLIWLILINHPIRNWLENKFS